MRENACHHVLTCACMFAKCMQQKMHREMQGWLNLQSRSPAVTARLSRGPVVKGLRCMDEPVASLECQKFHVRLQFLASQTLCRSISRSVICIQKCNNRKVLCFYAQNRKCCARVALKVRFVRELIAQTHSATSQHLFHY